MDTVPLLQTPLRSRKDVVRVVAQARQIARLLRFSALEQIEISCSAFSLSMALLQSRPRQSICFSIGAGMLQISARAPQKTASSNPGAADFCVRRSLPANAEMAREDFAWVIAHLQLLLEVDVLEVMRQQNEDLLGLVKALQGCRNDLDQLRHTGGKPSAA